MYGPTMQCNSSEVLTKLLQKWNGAVFFASHGRNNSQ